MAGRPLKFETVEELDSRIKDYFDNTPQPHTITGLALYLDCTRKTLLNYKGRDEFLPSLERALSICENEIATNALLNKYNPLISKLHLTNNYGWKEKVETQHSGEVTQKQYIISRGTDTPETIQSPPESVENNPEQG